MNKATQLTKDLKSVIRATRYSFEIDTIDVVFGFTKTNKTWTTNLAKAIKIAIKLKNDVGTFISPSVKIINVRIYKNGVLSEQLNG